MQTTDALAAGATLTITLNANGTTTGSLLIPASLNNGTSFTANLTGSFRLMGATVQFDQTADTFIRDMDFMLVGGRLEGNRTFSGTTINLVLTRT